MKKSSFLYFCGTFCGETGLSEGEPRVHAWLLNSAENTEKEQKTAEFSGILRVRLSRP